MKTYSLFSIFFLVLIIAPMPMAANIYTGTFIGVLQTKSGISTNLLLYNATNVTVSQNLKPAHQLGSSVISYSAVPAVGSLNASNIVDGWLLAVSSSPSFSLDTEPFRQAALLDPTRTNWIVYLHLVFTNISSAMPAICKFNYLTNGLGGLMSWTQILSNNVAIPTSPLGTNDVWFSIPFFVPYRIQTNVQAVSIQLLSLWPPTTNGWILPSSNIANQ